jgi:hypothetical protein
MTENTKSIIRVQKTFMGIPMSEESIDVLDEPGQKIIDLESGIRGLKLKVEVDRDNITTDASVTKWARHKGTYRDLITRTVATDDERAKKMKVRGVFCDTSIKIDRID